MPREALLARSLVELADSPVDDFDVVDLLVNQDLATVDGARARHLEQSPLT